jgi:hypothetical protein
MDLPQIQVIRLKTSKGFFEHLKSEIGITTVRTSLGHQEDFVTAAFEAGTHP